MKLIFIHIPKTAGSSISSVIEDASSGIWLKHAELASADPAYLWNLDYLSGHFTRKELLLWVDQNSLSLKNVKVLTVIRHPLEQLQSNLGFPFELSSREADIEEPWMKDILLLNPRSADDLYFILQKYPWILNMQWQFLVSGSDLVKTLDELGHVAVFPEISSAIAYACQALGVDLPKLPVTKNTSRKKFVKREVFAQSPLRELIIREHSLDIKLFTEVVFRRTGVSCGAEEFLDSWVVKQGVSS